MDYYISGAKCDSVWVFFKEYLLGGFRECEVCKGIPLFFYA